MKALKDPHQIIAVTLFFGITLMFAGCFNDVEDVVTFEVTNGLNEAIEITFSNYQTDHDRNYEKVDTSFIVDGESKLLVYYRAGRVLEEGTYRNDTELTWFETLTVQKRSSNAISTKSFTAVNEWTISKGKHNIGYDLTVAEDDF